MTDSNAFHRQIRDDYEAFLAECADRFPPDETITIDLHCHDHNSDVPDELWGRLLRLPETWLPTKRLVKRLRANGSDLVTITNHNNARSCWTLEDDGDEVLPASEFTCRFPDIDLSVHVLTYGFSREQEPVLNELRHDLYRFARFALEQRIPIVLAHPLYFYTHGKPVDIEILERFALVFERFEVFNGQRGYWQNLMTRYWIQSLTPERIDTLADKHGLNPHDFCLDPYNKRLTGGSDDHNGLFAGRCGTRLHIPNLQPRLEAGESRVALAREALLTGEMAPFGEMGEEEKLSTTFLDYFAQVAINMEDPGLLRLLLHKGPVQDKGLCFIVANLMLEMRRHDYTLAFLKTFHQALGGKKPKLWLGLGVSKEFRPLLAHLSSIAKAQRKQPDQFLDTLNHALPDMFRTVMDICIKRLRKHLKNSEFSDIGDLDPAHLIERFEIPLQLRSMLGKGHKKQRRMTRCNLLTLFDELSFPVLACSVLLGAEFTGRRVINNNRKLLNQLAANLNKGQHPHRVLWLTDTLVDRNGVSTVLQSFLGEIRDCDADVDLLVCHPTLEASEHLKVLRPLADFQLPGGMQTLYLPDPLALQRLFESGGYDRVICSTELLMGPLALYLKKAFNISAHFYMHTDWLAYLQGATSMQPASLDRVRRLLRAFYHQFDSVFVLNHEHRDWLTGPDMDLPEDQVHLTAHWPDLVFRNNQSAPKAINKSAPVLMYVGRLSAEKGVGDLVEVMQKVRTEVPGAQLVIAGTGPEEDRLKAALPEATFLGWIPPVELCTAYQQADLLLLPSRFDTFGCVVLEAMTQGVPVIAYNHKGPRDLIEDGQNGWLVEDAPAMARAVINYCSAPSGSTEFSRQALATALQYQPQTILGEMLQQMGSGCPDPRGTGVDIQQQRTNATPDGTHNAQQRLTAFAKQTENDRSVEAGSRNETIDTPLGDHLTGAFQ